MLNPSIIKGYEEATKLNLANAIPPKFNKNISPIVDISKKNYTTDLYRAGITIPEKKVFYLTFARASAGNVNTDDYVSILRVGESNPVYLVRAITPLAGLLTDIACYSSNMTFNPPIKCNPGDQIFLGGGYEASFGGFYEDIY